jgi:hypothetical protein
MMTTCWRLRCGRVISRKQRRAKGCTPSVLHVANDWVAWLAGVFAAIVVVLAIAAGALVFTARNFALVRASFNLTQEAQATDSFTKAASRGHCPIRMRRHQSARCDPMSKPRSPPSAARNRFTLVIPSSSQVPT